MRRGADGPNWGSELGNITQAPNQPTPANTRDPNGRWNARGTVIQTQTNNNSELNADASFIDIPPDKGNTSNDGVNTSRQQVSFDSTRQAQMEVTRDEAHVLTQSASREPRLELYQQSS